MTTKLGKGLASLMSKHSEPNLVTVLNIENIETNSEQPRKLFDEVKLRELAESIKNHGILQPIIVSQNANSKYTLIAGERRLRASILAGLTQIPAIIRNASEISILEMAIIENIQRENLNPIEEAEAYLYLKEKFQYTQEDLSKRLGKSRSHVANILRLNSIPSNIKEKVINKKISPSHARILSISQNADKLTDLVLDKALNVRQTEKLISKKKVILPSTKDEVDELHKVIRALAKKLRLKIDLSHKKNKYQMIFELNNLKEVDKLLAILES